jgi:hypothetical protein
MSLELAIDAMHAMGEPVSAVPIDGGVEALDEPRGSEEVGFLGEYMAALRQLGKRPLSMAAMR